MTIDAFAAQIVSLQDTLYRVSYVMLSSPEDQADAVQESIHKAFQHRDSLRDASRMKAWLVRILVNECNNILRRKKREVLSDTIEMDGANAAPTLADPGLREALMALDPKFRAPVVLHYIEGYGTKEIADILRVPEGTVKSRMMRARTMLKSILTDEEV